MSNTILSANAQQIFIAGLTPPLLRNLRNLRPASTLQPCDETAEVQRSETAHQKLAALPEQRESGDAGTAARACHVVPHSHTQADLPVRSSEESESLREHSMGNTYSQRKSLASGPC